MQEPDIRLEKEAGMVPCLYMTFAISFGASMAAVGTASFPL